MSEFEKQVEQIAADTRELTEILQKAQQKDSRGECTDDLLREAESLANVIGAEILDVCLVHIVKNIEVTNASIAPIAAAFMAAGRLLLNSADEEIRDYVEQFCDNTVDKLLDIAEG